MLSLDALVCLKVGNILSLMCQSGLSLQVSSNVQETVPSYCSVL